MSTKKSYCLPILGVTTDLSLAVCLGAAIYSSNPENLNRQIDEVKRFGDFLEQNKENIADYTVSKYLLELLKAKHLTRADVVKRTSLDKSYLYQIFNGRRNPSRNKLITIAFGINLTEAETQKMLRLSEYRELWVQDERDALILFAIRRGMSLQEVHTELERYGLAPLADPVR